MKSATKIVSVGLFLGVLVSIAAYQDAAAQFFGDNVGIISGVVNKGDSERGLVVRSTPSSSGAPMAWLPAGTKIHGSATFKNGYVKIEVPVKGGWVPLSFLEPEGGEAVVSRIDRPDMCLRIRSGPSPSSEKVGCAEMGQKLELTGIWSSNGWAQVSGPTAGWVAASQIESALKPLGTASTGVAKRPSSYDEEFRQRPATGSTIGPTYHWHRGWRR